MKDISFEILGLPEDASRAEIKAVWRQLCMQHHPDRGGDAEQFDKIQKAYVDASMIAAEPKNCPVCDGLGVTITAAGFMAVKFVCSRCNGTGKL